MFNNSQVSKREGKTEAEVALQVEGILKEMAHDYHMQVKQILKHEKYQGIPHDSYRIGVGAGSWVPKVFKCLLELECYYGYTSYNCRYAIRWFGLTLSKLGKRLYNSIQVNAAKLEQVNYISYVFHKISRCLFTLILILPLQNDLLYRDPADCRIIGYPSFFLLLLDQYGNAQ